MGMIPKNTRAKNKVLKGLTAMRFIGLMMTIMLSTMLGSFIGGWLKFLFIGFCIVIFFILTSKAPTNPNKSFAKGVAEYLSFLADNKKMVGSGNKEYKRYCKWKEIKNAKNKKNRKPKFKKSQRAIPPKEKA